jgi:glycosyltransferase involved in cell wall biosynthesis
MRVLEIINNLATGGAEVLLLELCSRFKKLGIEADVFVLKSVDGPLERELGRAGIRLLRSPVNRIYSLRQVAALRNALTGGSYDVIHAHLFPAQLWACMAARGVSKRPALITTEHNTSNRRRNTIWKPVDQWMYTQFQQIACISDGVNDALLESFGQSACRSLVVPNGIDLEKYTGSCKSTKMAMYGTEAPVVLCTGSLSPRKDQATIIRAIGLVPGVHLVLAGDGPLRESLTDLSLVTGVSDRVHFLGVRHDVRELIGTADVYVQASRVEGFGLAVVEAMAGGLPVIASNVPGLREVVGDAARLFEAGDHLGLASRIAELLGDPQLRRRLSEAGRTQARMFDVENTALAYAHLYEDAVRSTTRFEVTTCQPAPL